jgi:hypothetical protein
MEGTLTAVPRRMETRASHPMMGPGASHPGSCDTIKVGEPWVILIIDEAQGQPPYQYWSQHLSYSFLSRTQVLQENYCLRHIRPASRALFHSTFILILGRFPFLSLLFNCPRNPYCSTKARPFI